MNIYIYIFIYIYIYKTRRVHTYVYIYILDLHISHDARRAGARAAGRRAGGRPFWSFRSRFKRRTCLLICIAFILICSMLCNFVHINICNLLPVAQIYIYIRVQVIPRLIELCRDSRQPLPHQRERLLRILELSLWSGKKGISNREHLYTYNIIT